MGAGRGAGWLRAVREVVLLVLLYGAYSLVRSWADPSLAAASVTAGRLLDLERAVGLDVEAGANGFVAAVPWLAVPSAFWYAGLHLVVTGGLLVWLFLRRPDAYRRARSALVLATAAALVLFLLMPTAPPRLVGAPFHDVLAETAWAGWWPASGHASAPAGIGNELAAFPSMHAGWSFWVALTCASVAPRRARRWAWAYAGVTALVVVVTGNHWVVDVLAGWVLVGAASFVVRRRARRSVGDPAPTDAVRLPDAVGS